MTGTRALFGKSMLRGLAVVLLLGAGATAVLAQGDPLAERKALFKQMAAAMKEPGQMLKGEAPFDLVKVKQGLAVIAANSAKLGDLFPDTSKSGDTHALAKVWEDKADFSGRFEKLNKDAAAALVSIDNVEGFRAALPKVLGNCGACHKIYRKPT